MSKERLSNIILNYRHRNRLTQEKFAKRCGLSRAYISFLENEYNPTTGENPIPTLETYDKIARAMDMTRDQLISRIEGKRMFENPLSIKIEVYPVPCISVIPEGDFDLSNLTTQLDLGEDTYQIPKELYKRYKTIAFIISSNNYTMGLKKGDRAITWLDEELKDGDYVALKNADGTIGIQKLFIKEDIMLLYSGIDDEPIYYESKSKGIVGKVVQIHRSL